MPLLCFLPVFMSPDNPDFGYLITCIILQLDNSLHPSITHFPLVYRSAFFFLIRPLSFSIPIANNQHSQPFFQHY